MDQVNRRWLVAARPQGPIRESDFQRDEAPKIASAEAVFMTLFASMPAVKNCRYDMPSMGGLEDAQLSGRIQREGRNVDEQHVAVVGFHLVMAEHHA